MTGFRSTIMRFVDDKLTVVVLTNSGSCDPERIAQGVAAVYVPALAKQVQKAIPDKEPKVTAFLRKLLEDAAQGKFDASVLAPGMEKILTPEAVQRGAMQLKALGAIKKIELLNRADQGDTRLYGYRVTFANGVLICGFALTKDDKIAGIQFSPG